MPFESINFTNPKTNPWNFHDKILRIGVAGKWGFFESAILIFFCLISVKNNFVFHMRYHLFLHYVWFLQNLGKDFIRTNMHTTVSYTLFFWARIWGDPKILRSYLYSNNLNQIESIWINQIVSSIFTGPWNLLQHVRYCNMLFEVSSFQEKIRSTSSKDFVNRHSAKPSKNGHHFRK